MKPDQKIAYSAGWNFSEKNPDLHKTIVAQISWNFMAECL
jgi:hypothetical protein